MPEALNCPPPPSASTSCWLPRSKRSPEEARRALEKLLAGLPHGQRFADAGLLLVSELVTNAVVHGTPPGNRIWLALSVDGSRLRIEVHDARAERGPILRTTSGEDESGRGLLLVKSLSQQWGCCPREHVGKIIWAEITPESAAGSEESAA
ncbi:ATP-binding protein [Kitasatospora sp. NPDC088351]|uniref:ATP-binding protein n=1 Tax=unclassified Kitasatospora TaxID=2633591 RepID=UPI00342664CE